ncbi:HsdR family type I site-specific deoxyribonuclease [Planctomycetota bacterium]|nr:HsdR family type I site-specific deoxyribonuclease [Planctomycetota bacterium]
MTHPNEYTLVEKPIIEFLGAMQPSYRFIPSSKHPRLRTRENEVLFKPLLIDALVRINGIPKATAEAVFNDLAGLSDNERWVEVLRGNYSRKVEGEETHRTIRVIDFEEIANNHFACTNQLRVQGEVVRKPDVVIYVNGIPLVVIEAKSPLNPSQNTFDAIDQVRSAEKEIPRLFHSNLFNIATNDMTFRYGATGASSEWWFRWRDPWPRQAEELTDETEKGLYALLEPSRLLDILAHFIVFETREGKTVKKVCRYQQFRAVNKMVQRVIDGEQRAGLIWHTQGSGKSLTMVFAALKLKFHRGITNERLQNPNMMVLTDRIDLHTQIAQTFEACGLPNPIPAESISKLRKIVVPGVSGRTVISTIFKFHWDDPRLKSKVHAQRLAALRELAVEGSENWILMVDEAHRTQEKDLGAYVRAVLPDAVRFGFTGTPVKKGDKDTFQNFGAPGESYLDKYGIDDAVADGATVPIYYQGRMTEWHLHDKEIDVLFDQWFSNEPEEKIEELKRRGVTKGDLARFGPRINLIAVDIWAHYRAHVMPDGFKAQICAIDRRACVAYKVALDRVIAQTLVKTEGLTEEEAKKRAAEMSVCIYSPGQHDGEQYPELVEYQIPPEDVTPIWVEKKFKEPSDPLKFLIICNKLLTGFDAPIEQAMYLDNPLTDHNLLQAIARTNRRYGAHKDHGLIVDYIGVSKKLDDALAAYRKEDVASAMNDQDELADKLRAAHRAVMALIDVVPRTDEIKADVKAVIVHLATEDDWFVFRSNADAFVKAYSALSPDPRVLSYQADLKFVAAVMPYGKLHFEQVEETDWKKYSEKVRAMLDEHLEVIGLKTVCKLRSLTDPGFWDDFGGPMDLKTAAVRKLAELKKETRERATKNPARYEKFSDRVKELIQKFNAGLLDAKDALKATEAVAKEVLAEDEAHKGTGLNERAFGLHAILEKHRTKQEGETDSETPKGGGDGDGENGGGLTALQQAALAIDGIYSSNDAAPPPLAGQAPVKEGVAGASSPAGQGPGPRRLVQAGAIGGRALRRHSLQQAVMRVLTVGDTDVPYEVRFSPKAIRKRIVVTPAGVEVVVPTGTPQEGRSGVLDYVDSKRRWIFDSVREIEEKHRKLLTQRYASGAKLQYRGRWLMLDVTSGLVDQVEISCRSKFHVVVPQELDRVARLEAIRAAFEEWLRTRALRDVKRFGRGHADDLGVEVKGWRLADSKTRWGSCGRDGIVRIHWRLVQAPAAAMDYVVGHEVAHVLHRHHKSPFWTALGLTMPDWAERRAMLEAWESDHRAV